MCWLAYAVWVTSNGDPAPGFLPVATQERTMHSNYDVEVNNTAVSKMEEYKEFCSLIDTLNVRRF